MARRFASGSVTPARAARKRSAARTCTRSTRKWARKVSSTCSASPARSSPWSMNTQVNWSPTARWTRAAATAESTPPDSPQSTLSPPTRRRTPATACSMIEARVQVGRAPQASKRNALRTSSPRGVCTTSGWNCTP